MMLIIIIIIIIKTIVKRKMLTHLKFVHVSNLKLPKTKPLVLKDLFRINFNGFYLYHAAAIFVAESSMK